MLTLEGQPLPLVNGKARLLAQISKSSAVAASTKAFANAERDRTDPPRKVICVLQGEYAEADLSKEHVVLAATDATTCCIAALTAPAQQWALIAHLDSRCKEQLQKALLPILQKKPEGRAHLHLVGGFGADGKGVAEQVLQALHALPHLQLEVGVAALGTLNTRDTGNIVHRNLALDTSSGAVSPAVTPEERGPLYAQRNARSMSPTGTCMVPIYNNRFQLLHIAPVHMPLQLIAQEHLQELLAADDATLLQDSSTSPDQEAPKFCEDTRATLRWILDGDGRRAEAAQFEWAVGAGSGGGGWVAASRELAVAK